MKTILISLLAIMMMALPASAITFSMGSSNNGNSQSTTMDLSLSDGSSMSSSSRIGADWQETVLKAQSAGNDRLGISSGGNTVYAATTNGTDIGVTATSAGIAGDVDGIQFESTPGLISETAAINAVGEDVAKVQVGTSALVSTSQGYVLTGKRWNQRDPNIKLSLTSNTALTAEGLITYDVLKSVNRAQKTWDAASTQNLYNDDVMYLTTANAGTYDKTNAITFKPLSSTAIAVAQTWYSTSNPVDGYYSIVQSDISLNTRYSWTTSMEANKVDVESIILHEAGHGLGLGDLYAPEDNDEAMDGTYEAHQRTLGDGDRAGIWALYG